MLTNIQKSSLGDRAGGTADARGKGKRSRYLVVLDALLTASKQEGTMESLATFF